MWEPGHACVGLLSSLREIVKLGAWKELAGVAETGNKVQGTCAKEKGVTRQAEVVAGEGLPGQRSAFFSSFW